MAAVIKGLGVKFSVGGITFAGAIVSTASTGHFTQSLNVERNSEKALIKDTGGTVRSAIFHGFMKRLTVNVVPAGSTVANAITSLDAFLAQPGGSVIITDTTGTIADATYNLISAKEGRTVDGVATVDLELETGDESNDITTLVS